MTTFPTLFKKASTGKIQEWHIEVIVKTNDASVAVIETTFGQLGGKKQTAQDVITEGKNIGRSNETTAYEQAVSEAKSQWEKKKKDKGYVESIEDAEAGLKDALVLGGADVMLAHKFADQGHKITYPCYVQPKLDGHRCVAIVKDGKCTLWSRTRKEIFGVPHIQNFLQAAFKTEDIVLDGELYNHDYKDQFETLSSFIRQTDPKPGHEIVQFHVYDVINSDPFFKRTEKLAAIGFWSHLSSRAYAPVVAVDTEEVDNYDELMSMFYTYTSQGYEGEMARNLNSLYVGKRSYDLQKIKEFDDAEFEIVDVIPGERGKMQDKGVFLCRTDSGAEFKAKMVGELDSLREYLDNKEKYCGKMLTVKYQGLTGKNGVPRFPVAMRIREDV